MIRCGIAEEVISLYCRKLADSVSFFGEQYKDSLRLFLILPLLLKYEKIEDANKETFWHFFEKLSRNTDFEVNSQALLGVNQYEEAVTNNCVRDNMGEIKQHFIFYFLFHYLSFSKIKLDALACVLTELKESYQLDCGVLDYKGRSLYNILDLTRPRPSMEAHTPGSLLCFCEYHQRRRSERFELMQIS